VKLSIDMDRCTGHGRCYSLAPEVFGADDAGYAELLVDGDVPAGLEDKARQASMNCPERAITVID
jgi:ferredoxin